MNQTKTKTNLPTILVTLFVSMLLIAATASACPATYVKEMAENNQGTALYEKSAEVADKYMTNRGMDPKSPAGEVTRPYVIGTTIVEHNEFRGSLREALGDYYVEDHHIDLDKDTVDEAVAKALGQYADTAGSSNSDLSGHMDFDENGLLAHCSEHFNRHFGNGIFLSAGLSKQTETENHGG